MYDTNQSPQPDGRLADPDVFRRRLRTLAETSPLDVVRATVLFLEQARCLRCRRPEAPAIGCPPGGCRME